MSRTKTMKSPTRALYHALAAVVSLILIGNGGFAFSDIKQNTSDRFPEGMVWIPGGTFSMGSNDALARRVEQPPHQVEVAGFWMDKTEVTNAQFKQFVAATDYVTTAELAGNASACLETHERH